MTSLVRISSLCLGVLLLSGCSEPTAKSNPSSNAASNVAKVYTGPAVADFAIWRPYFEFSSIPIDPDAVKATAFAVLPGGDRKSVLVTVLHPGVGSESPLTDPDSAASFRSTIERVAVTEAFGAGDEMRDVGQLILPNTEEPPPSTDLVNDLLLIDPARMERRIRPLEFASQFPKQGDSVWMATAVYGGASPSTVAHEAILTECDPNGRWAYRFVNERLALQATSGAPLLNTDGKVVGIHLTGDETSDEIAGVGISGAQLLEQLGRLNEKR